MFSFFLYFDHRKLFTHLFSRLNIAAFPLFWASYALKWMLTQHLQGLEKVHSSSITGSLFATVTERSERNASVCLVATGLSQTSVASPQ